MPLIEYRCTECAQVFERLVPRTEGVERGECPSCGQSTGRRVLSMVAPPRRAEGASAPQPMAMPSGECCGGSCCAGH
jgi:putative FmdB family regulatory protein